MKLKTEHIAHKFLTDYNFVMDMVGHFNPEIMRDIHAGVPKEQITDRYKDNQRGFSFVTNYDTAIWDGSKNFAVTDTVFNQLDMLKVSKTDGSFDWKIFSGLKEKDKRTYIFNNQSFLRVYVREKYIHFIHTTFKLLDDKTGYGDCHFVLYYVNRETGETCAHFKHPDVQQIEELTYKLLCFVLLSDTQEVVVKPGQSHGTRRHGKVKNEWGFPVTVINSHWNITSVRTEGFNVSGHFRLQPTKAGVRVIFINPFQKHGYVRKAKREDHA